MIAHFMEEILRITLIVISIVVVVTFIIMIINKLVDKFVFSKNTYETYFGSTVFKSDKTGNYILLIKGCDGLYEGGYHIVFRLADGSDITLCDTDMNFSKSWFFKHFTKTVNAHGFIISKCPTGIHLMIVEIMNEHMRQTLYVPLDIQSQKQEDLQCREENDFIKE